jgi:hypothetical protein
VKLVRELAQKISSLPESDQTSAQLRLLEECVTFDPATFFF